MNTERILHKLTISLVLTILIFVVWGNIADAYPKTVDFTVLPADANYVPDELLIRFGPKPDGKQHNLLEKSQILSSLGGGVIERDFEIVPGLTLVKLPPGLIVKDALKIYNNTEGILHAHPNYIIELLSKEPNDLHFSDQWGLYNYGQGFHEGTGEYPSQGTEDADIDAPEAWDVNTTSSITVAVIDTGVDYEHPDLVANMWDDGQGHCGHDYVNGGDYPMDDHYHGTHIAGCIGAVGNNGTGITGVAWKVKIMVIKSLNSSGSGTTANAISAINYAVNHGANIINASWGGSAYDPDLEVAIENAGTAGILFIAAAGNDGHNTDSNPHYPSSYDCNNIISVMATDRNDYLADGFE